jgi:hypothetical protein
MKGKGILTMKYSVHVWDEATYEWDEATYEIDANSVEEAEIYADELFGRRYYEIETEILDEATTEFEPGRTYWNEIEANP